MKFRYALALAATFAITAPLAALAADPAPTDKPAASDKSAKGANEMQSKLEMREKLGWEAFKNDDAKTFYSVMSREGCMIDQTGVNKGAAVETMMKDYELKNYALEGFQAMSLGKDVMVLTYTAKVEAAFQGQAIPAGPWYCSTVYVKKGGDWMGMYHQETLGMAPGATPPAQTTGQ